MERLSAILPITSPSQIALTLKAAPVQSALVPIASPADIPPIVLDPAYQNLAFASAMNKYVEDKKQALNDARAAMDAANAAAMQTSGGGSDNLIKAAAGAGALWLLVKFVL
jgi:hypothetical protein